MCACLGLIGVRHTGRLTGIFICMAFLLFMYVLYTQKETLSTLGLYRVLLKSHTVQAKCQGELQGLVARTVALVAVEHILDISVTHSAYINEAKV